ncbi:hypothetical protein H112_02744 [Trichophyton rubrum D6]|uniref:Uncharacterized protein n=3 Tax=Trichophyton TaxID=5550 RepID=A0A080WL00_TRIRC|nr:uncharacterized protein TERG_12416 [Trichophyton rubrum CBS 118892]EZF24779.1 hypothetical protein H100_02750 [Trichophyton rubrum MR850]EZF43831.1 hypothetical protein H102_02743 [Trichophyton rubrum CBS 100081]EZF54472.1 hypothetical protein H103_02754 [Trichophyton rubrum CBS 288.86]EZF65145.1 hypothetical protein H104_02733 [Trichophyton rubrum CBS 289.86]EZF75812.1 hypothetical protein H105_02760 [Trichophyton soudanense CBS 452.61]EZF86408.1 hypothetical protein H110_02752 [Trichophy
MVSQAAYPYLISKVADPLFAIVIGSSAAFIRIRREHRERFPDQPSDFISLLSLAQGRASRWWNNWQ